MSINTNMSMLNLMAQYPALSGQKSNSTDVTQDVLSSYYANYPSLYVSSLMTAHNLQSSTNSASSQTSFLIDDILGKRSRESHNDKERHTENERERDSERRRSVERLRDTEGAREADRVRENELYERTRGERTREELFREECTRDLERHKERERQSAIRDQEREREREYELHREEERHRKIERQRDIERENERQSHLHSITLPKTISSTNSSAELARPTPINPAAIQTSALTIPAAYKPLPTMYDPTVQSYLSSQMSACQTSLMRQMYGALPYGRPDYPTLFDGQCNAFSKGDYLFSNY